MTLSSNPRSVVSFVFNHPLCISVLALGLVTQSCGLECIEGFVSIADERQTHLSILLTWYRLGLGTVCSAVILLRNFVDREVADIDIRRQFWFERSTDLAKIVPDYSSEEWVPLDGRRTIVRSTIITETVLSVAKEAIIRLALRTRDIAPLTF